MLANTEPRSSARCAIRSHWKPSGFRIAKNFEIRPEEVIMKINVLFAMLIWVGLLPGSASAQSTSTQPGSTDGMTMLHHNDISMNHMSTDPQHGLAVPVSYAEL